MAKRIEILPQLSIGHASVFPKDQKYSQNVLIQSVSNLCDSTFLPRQLDCPE